MKQIKLLNKLLAVKRIFRLTIKSIQRKDFASFKDFPFWLSSLLPNKTPINQEMPWVTVKAIRWLENNLKNTYSVFEYGSGGSTFFFSKKVKKVISIEHDKSWFELVDKKLKKEKINNCKYVLAEPIKSKKKKIVKYASFQKNYRLFSFEKYVKTIDGFKENFFDLVFIDGRSRSMCIKHSIKKIRRGGYLVLDNSQRKEYLLAIKKYLSKFKRIDFNGVMIFGCNDFSQTSIWKIV